MSCTTLFEQVLDPDNRANPYPLFAQLRRQPVCRQEDGTFVVSTHAEIARLVADPRISSEDLPDPQKFRWTGHPITDLFVRPIRAEIRRRHQPFIFRDPPDHDRLRGLVMRAFSPERVRRMRQETTDLTNELIEKFEGKARIDLVDDFSYPVPVTVICKLLGVPPEDEPQFQGWATQLATALEPNQRGDEETRAKNEQCFTEISEFLRDLIARKRKEPQDDILTDLANGDDDTERMNDFDLIATAVLLLVAGHETTVNLITNSVLTLLRFPEHWQRLAREPEIAPRLIEEMLRYEPPVQYRTRLAIADIPIAGVTIPKDAPVVLLLASGNRDPARFADPDRFDPDRSDNRHLGFGGGLHYCVGAPLARIEAEVALVSLAKRLGKPRLVEDPPPYRPGASLRGPRHLCLSFDGIAQA